jgi:hypothetical protein
MHRIYISDDSDEEDEFNAFEFKIYTQGVNLTVVMAVGVRILIDEVVLKAVVTFFKVHEYFLLACE